MAIAAHLGILLLLCLFVPILAQAPRPNGRDAEGLDPLEAGSTAFRRRRRSPCSNSFRTLDGTCTNRRNPTFGSVGTPQFSYFNRFTQTPSGEDLPSARLVSNILTPQTGDVFNDRGMSELVTFFAQFLDHTFAATPLSDDKMPIEIPEDDPIFANFSGELEFERSMRATVEGSGGNERPINSLSSAVDLVSVYGPSKERSDFLRSFSGGKLKVSAGNLLPFNTAGLVNAPNTNPNFFIAGDHRANEHPVLTAMHTLFVREHNTLCDELSAAFPSMDDENLFQNAREINIAQFQKIVFEEFFPAIAGRRLRRYRGFRRNENPTLSMSFSTAAFRVGHTLVGNVVNLEGPGNSPLPSISFMDLFFRPSSSFTSPDPFIRGAANNFAQEIDLGVVRALRNFLFTRIPEEIGFDLVALNLQRSRDHNLPSFSELRARFRGAGRLRNFRQISRNRNVQSRLATAYGTPDKVEAWIGLVAEDHAPGSSLGPTMLGLWQREFTRLRDGDRFYFQQDGFFSREIRRAIRRVREFQNEQDTFRAIILRNTDITSSELPPRVFFNLS